MTQDNNNNNIPLGLQVFHSLNEYEAHRLNRTEQIRLNDLRTVLNREEKLYMKEHSFLKNKFNAHHHQPKENRYVFTSGSSSSYGRRRNSVASSSFLAPSVFSQPTRSRSRSSSGALSAPAKLQQRNGSISSSSNGNSQLKSALASQLCSSLSRLSTSNKFQRVQRKFSIASLTENGLITKKGISMSKNIPKVRNMMFRRKSPFPLPTETKPTSSQPNPDPNSFNPIDTISEITSEDASDDNHDDNIPADHDEVNGRQHTLPLSKALTALRESDIQGEETSGNIAVTSSEDNGMLARSEQECISIRTPSAILSAPKYRSNTNNPPRSNKKRVTIKNEVDFDSESVVGGTVDFNDSPSGAISENRNDLPGSSGRELDAVDWSSIFLRPSTGVKFDPLQGRIKSFLADQTVFNRSFPKGEEVSPEINDIQRELRKRANARKETKKNEMTKKNGIVIEVLNELGIKDPYIMSHYDIEVRE